VVTRRVGDVDCEVERSNGEIYHLNLLKLWNEERPVRLATSVIEEGELGPEVQKAPPFTSVDSYSAPENIFSPLPGRTALIKHQIETPEPEHKWKILIYRVQGEIGLLHSIWVIPVQNTSIRVVQFGHIPETHGPGAVPARRVCSGLPGRCHYS